MITKVSKIRKCARNILCFFGFHTINRWITTGTGFRVAKCINCGKENIY
jgi:hypothetical protein